MHRACLQEFDLAGSNMNINIIARVTVLAWSFRLSVGLSVCLSIELQKSAIISGFVLKIWLAHLDYPNS